MPVAVKEGQGWRGAWPSPMNERRRLSGVYTRVLRAVRVGERRARESMDEFKSRIFASASWNPTPPMFINDTLRNRDSHPDWNGTYITNHLCVPIYIYISLGKWLDNRVKIPRIIDRSSNISRTAFAKHGWICLMNLQERRKDESIAVTFSFDFILSLIKSCVPL